jgi:alpha-galactosidase
MKQSPVIPLRPHPLSPISSSRQLLIAATVLLHGLLATSNALDNGLARLPPMGWNSWNKFGLTITDEIIRQTADALVSSGMKAAGYTYLVIDDGWMADSRDAAGNLQAHSGNFPSGIKSLADYVHGKGLKFGIYSSSGSTMCSGRPGSQGHYQQDADQFAAWGCDFLKLDNCGSHDADAPTQYRLMGEALRKTKRPIVFSVCEWGVSKPWEWADTVGHMARVSFDVIDMRWGNDGGVNSNRGLHWATSLDIVAGLSRYAGPGYWNDPDFLTAGLYGNSYSSPVSNGGGTTEEFRSQFALWCITVSPLIASCDLRAMSSETRDMLTNAELIAVNQDTLAVAGSRVKDDGDFEVWCKPLSDQGKAVVLFNRSAASKAMTVRWSDIGLASGSALVRDLWMKKDLGQSVDTHTTTVPSHGTAALKIKSVGIVPIRAGMVGTSSANQANVNLRMVAAGRIKIRVVLPAGVSSGTLTLTDPQGRLVWKTITGAGARDYSMATARSTNILLWRLDCPQGAKGSTVVLFR